MAQNPVHKLHALTTLRFFAAAMIVIHHSVGFFGIPRNISATFPFMQAVSFFFVLSGFILVYVYPSLDTWQARGRFWLARFARVWPAHFAAFALLWLILRNPSQFPTGYASFGLALLNLSLVHAWIPLRDVFFSFNSVSWTVSTEVGFYLLFPLLIWKWKKTWWFILPLTLIIAVAAAVFSKYAQLPIDDPTKPWAVSATGIVYVNPLSRLFEFAVGMTAALLFQRTAHKIRLPILVGTLLELAALAFAFASMYYAINIIATIYRLLPSAVDASYWLVEGPTGCLSFATLIYIMGLQSGYISRLLSIPLGIVLGEISYSVYLIHPILLTFYVRQLPIFANWSGWFAYALFWLIVLLLSWLVWALVERPMRAWLVARWPKRDVPSRVPPRSPIPWAPLLSPNALSIAIATVLLFAALVPVGFALNKPIPIAQVPPAEIQHILTDGVKDVQGARFGDHLELLGAQLTRTPAGLDLALAWRALQTLPSNFSIGVHLTDNSGNILSQFDYHLVSAPPSSWVDHVLLPADKLAVPTHVAIALFQPSPMQTYAVDRGPRDWKDHRLLIPLPTY